MDTKLDSIFLESWQSLLKDQIQDIRLVDLVIPGTHNSNTYEIQCIGSSFAQNQIWDISQQLKNGIRFFDLRYGYNDKENIFVDKHGPLKGADYFKKFQIIKEYLDTHTEEFIIIKIQAEDSLEQQQKKQFKKQLYNSIGKYLITNEDKWFDLSKVKMKDIWQYKKRIFLVYKNYLTKFPNCEDIGIFCNEGNLNSFWPDTGDIEDLMKQNLNLLKERQDKKELQNQLFQNSFMLTGQEDVKDLIQQVMHKGIPTINNMIKILEDNKKRIQVNHIIQQ